MKPQAFVFIGRAGSGKGTQSRLLIEELKAKDPAHDVVYVETGAQFRNFIQADSYTAKLAKDVVEKGLLMPECMAIYLWCKQLVEQYKGNQHIIFDGTPRKLLEAQSLDLIFPFYELGKPWVIYLDIEHEESSKRLALRAKQGRKDDDTEAIERRRIVFERDVMPTVGYYRNSPNVNVLDIDGERTIPEVHAEIVESLGLK